MKEVDIPTKWIETATMILHLHVKILAAWSIDVLVLIPGTFQKIGEGTKSCLISGISNTQPTGPMRPTSSVYVALRLNLL
jgi:hypothetical protein